MVEHEPERYGESFADVYDEWYGEVSDVDATVEFMAGLGVGTEVLELGVGTGRLALALSEAGFTVTGLDASDAMLARLATNDPARSIAAVSADMARFDLGRTFDAVLVAFNTLFNLTTLEAQQQCFNTVANHLDHTGRFVVEAVVPATTAVDRGLGARHLPDGGVVLTATTTDHTTGVTQGNHIQVEPGGDVHLRPWKIRVSTPDELDQMAHTAGLELVDRTADWDRSPFDNNSSVHISVYRRRSSDASIEAEEDT